MMCKRNVVFFQQQFVVGRRHTSPSTTMTSMFRIVAITFALITIGPYTTVIAEDGETKALSLQSVVDDGVDTDDQTQCVLDHRIWLVSSRRLSCQICSADLKHPNLAVSRVSRCGQISPSSMDAFLARSNDRTTVVYVHGNRINDNQVLERAFIVYGKMCGYLANEPLDWVIFSWPSSKSMPGLRDVRRKAKSTDLHGLYLAWLLRENFHHGSPTAMIGYSFGGRMITGSLHALAGGSLGGRTLDGDGVTGADISVGVLAPALPSNWLSPGCYHGLATQNMHDLKLFYNSRDILLTRYWRLPKIRGVTALGSDPPRVFGLRSDGSPLPVQYRDCKRMVGAKHIEVEYYKRCNAGGAFAQLIKQRITSECLTNENTISIRHETN